MNHPKIEPWKLNKELTVDLSHVTESQAKEMQLRYWEAVYETWDVNFHEKSQQGANRQSRRRSRQEVRDQVISRHQPPLEQSPRFRTPISRMFIVNPSWDKQLEPEGRRG